MVKTLHPYQQVAVDECLEALKESTDPVLLMASVGAGKSLMIADILLLYQCQNKRALCIVNNSELVRNNRETFEAQGGTGGIYCASLNEKNTTAPVIFGTPQSVIKALRKDLGKIKFDLIVVDEAHNIAYHERKSLFMRILNHYSNLNPPMRLLGATGTNYRFKGNAIVGDKCLFKKQVGNITTDRLIAEGYLIDPRFQIDPSLVIDFSQVRIKSNGQFDAKQLQEVVDQNSRLTRTICDALVHIMENENRFGVFIFATTKAHAKEILTYLPEDESALVLGETKVEERTALFNAAREGKIRYLVNISIISVGVDIPAYDTIAYLRPTESLVLMTQTMGRGLRLAPNKTDCLVLDFAGNIERHRDWDNPILLEALRQTVDKEQAYDVRCPACQTMNPHTSRRCIGVFERKGRCDYFFEWQDCPNDECKAQNDIASRHCRICQAEIIDPNKKLSLHPLAQGCEEVDVIEAKYGISGNSSFFRVHAAYLCVKDNKKQWIYERFIPTSQKARNYFYGQFVKHHSKSPSKYYPFLDNKSKIEEMLADLKTPDKLHIKPVENDIKIHKRIFVDSA